MVTLPWFKSILIIFLIYSVQTTLCKEDIDSSETNSVKEDISPSSSSSPSDSDGEKVDYKTPVVPLENVYLYEPFDVKNTYQKIWVTSKATKSDSDDDKYDGQWEIVPTVEKMPGKEDKNLIL